MRLSKEKEREKKEICLGWKASKNESGEVKERTRGDEMSLRRNEAGLSRVSQSVDSKRMCERASVNATETVDAGPGWKRLWVVVDGGWDGGTEVIITVTASRLRLFRGVWSCLVWGLGFWILFGYSGLGGEGVVRVLRVSGALSSVGWTGWLRAAGEDGNTVGCIVVVVVDFWLLKLL